MLPLGHHGTFALYLASKEAYFIMGQSVSGES
jgi:hypothetical protein